MRVPETAEKLGIPAVTLYHWLRHGCPPLGGARLTAGSKRERIGLLERGVITLSPRDVRRLEEALREDPDWPTAWQAAKRFKTSDSHVRLLVKRGQVRSRRGGRKIRSRSPSGVLRVSASDLQTALAARRPDDVPSGWIEEREAPKRFPFTRTQLRQWREANPSHPRALKKGQRYAGVGRRGVCPYLGRRPLTWQRFRLKRGNQLRWITHYRTDELEAAAAAKQTAGAWSAAAANGQALTVSGERPGGKPAKRVRGRPKGSKRRTTEQVAADARLWRDFTSSGLPTYEEFARARGGGMRGDDVKAAIDRARKDRRN